MSNVLKIILTAKRERELDIKINNAKIIHRLWEEGRIKKNPLPSEKIWKRNVIDIPEECFVRKQFYRVGV